MGGSDDNAYDEQREENLVHLYFWSISTSITTVYEITPKPVARYVLDIAITSVRAMSRTRHNYMITNQRCFTIGRKTPLTDL